MKIGPSDVTFAAGISEDVGAAALAAPHFRRWLAGLVREFDLRAVHVRDVVMFGRRAGFVLAEADVRDREGNRLPGVAFLRGDSVAVLPVVVPEEGEPLVLLTRQARVPIASAGFHEIPAGMLDDGDFASKALEEMAEEIGVDLTISERDLVPVGDLHTSPGGSDETVRVYVAEIRDIPNAADLFHGRRTGNRHESEAITVVAATLAEARDLVDGDMKSVFALDWYELEVLRRANDAEATYAPAP